MVHIPAAITVHNCKEGKDDDGYDSTQSENVSTQSENVSNEMDGFLVGGDGSDKFNDACSNCFAVQLTAKHLHQNLI